MNPLDKEELKAFLKIIKNDMPLHTDTSAKIKCSFSQGMPKNLKEYSDKVDNKFLNDNLHTIEEMEYRKKGITNDFKEYQNKYYDESGILNHDLYFEHEGTIYPKLAGGSFFSQSFLSTSSASLNRTSSPTNGAEIETGTSIGQANFGMNRIELFPLPNTGVIGTLYNRIALYEAGSSGNRRIACYSGSTPTELLGESASFAHETSYTFQSVTEFSLLATQNWVSALADTNNNYRYFSGASGIRKHKVFTFGAYPNPAGTGYTDGTESAQMKIAHS